MIVDFIFVAVGLALLFLGGESLVRGSVAIAERLGLSKLLIGLTIVGFGTSAPELLVSLNAALGGASDIALGNVVGSNIANIFLVVGIAAVILPIAGWQRTAGREALIAGVIALALYGIAYGQTIGRLEGAAMLVVLSIYLIVSYRRERRQPSESVFEKETEEFEDLPLRSAWLPPALALIGIGLLVLGADLLVDGSVSIARAFGVSDAVIGLSLIAIGTSLPELATAIVAAVRKHSDVVLGNVIGSSIFNVLAILGITAVVQPISVNERFRDFDILVMLAASATLILLLYGTKSIGRLAGAAMIGAYALYTAALYSKDMAPWLT